MITKIYVDSDGVLADLYSWVKDNVQGKLTSESFGKILVTNERAYLDCKVLDKDLLNLVRQRDDFYVLTSIVNPTEIAKYLPEGMTLGEVQERMRKNKMEWFKRHGVDLRKVLIMTNSKDKVQYANSSTMLIDDYTKNVDMWNEAGGIGYLYKEYSQR